MNSSHGAASALALLVASEVCSQTAPVAPPPSPETVVTGVALLTLKSVGRPNEDPAVARAQRLLLARQSADGRRRGKGRHFHPEKYHTAYDARTTGFAVAALSLTLPKLPPGTKPLFTPDPALAAEVAELTSGAAEGYTGRPDRAGDPTEQPPAKKPPNP